MIYNENDLKGQPLQQSLTTENIETLTLAGDSSNLMQSSSIIPTEYNENRVLYKKVIDNNIEFYEFSNNSSDELYSIKFSYVGDKMGDYSLLSTSAISNIYEYKTPVNSVKQGNYQPITNLVAPEKIQVAIINGDYQISNNTKIMAFNLDHYGDEYKGLITPLTGDLNTDVDKLIRDIHSPVVYSLDNLEGIKEFALKHEMFYKQLINE